MTTPVQPTPAPTTPAAPASAREFFQQDDAALAQAWGVNVEAPQQEERELAGVAAPVEGAEPPETIPTNDEGDEVDIPQLTRKPMTEFVVMDEGGEVGIPDVKIKFKAKGEQRELPLDHVVRLAQFGFANEEREQQVLAARKFVAEAEQQTQTLNQQIQQYESHYDRLFNDPAFYEEARLAYLSQNTPEHRAVRAEQALYQERQTQRVAQEVQQVQGFVQQNLVPRVQQMLAENPHVNEHEVLGRYTELTAPLLVNGRVPLERLRLVQQLVNSDLADWVQQKHAEREITRQSQQTRQQQEQTKFKTEVAGIKRQASRVFAQPGRPATDLGAPAKPVKYSSAKDWLNSTFGAND